MTKRKKKEPFPVQRGKTQPHCPIKGEDRFCKYQPDGQMHECTKAGGGHFSCGVYLGVKAGRLVIEGVDL